MKEKGWIGKIGLTLFGNGTLLLSKIFVWLTAPKLLGAAEYGYYKTFTLYLIYAAWLHFGFPDGILLHYAGKDVPKNREGREKLRAESSFFLLFQMLVSFCVCAGALIAAHGRGRFIGCMLGLDLLFQNMTTYYRFLSQAFMKFREFSLRNILQAAAQCAVAAVLYGLHKWAHIAMSGKLYIGCMVWIDGCLFIWYLFTYRELAFSDGKAVWRNKKRLGFYFRMGILLTAAYQLEHLLFAADSQMVSLFYDLRTYGIYSFAYSVTSLILVIVNAASIVLLPGLKQMRPGEAAERYSKIMAFAAVFVSAALCGYYPVCWFVRRYLPEYAEGLRYLRIIWPGILWAACIDLVLFTYYKAFQQLKDFLKYEGMALAAAVFLNLLCHFVCKDPAAYSAASMLVLIGFFFMEASSLSKKIGISWRRDFFYLILETGLFYLSVFRREAGVCSCLLFIGGTLAAAGFTYRKLV